TVAFDAVYRGNFSEIGSWKSVDPAQLAQRLQLTPAGSVQFAFTSNAVEPEAINLELTRARPRLTANSLTTITVEQRAVEYALALDWRIGLAGADEFVFTGPSWLFGRLDFATGGPRIRQVLESDAGEGRTRWTLRLEEPQRDRYFV